MAAAGYRIWIGRMDNAVTMEDLEATFMRFGALSEGIRMRTDTTHPKGRGTEAVITYIDKADAARALSVEYIGTDRVVWISWYEQRPLWSEYTRLELQGMNGWPHPHHHHL